MAVVPYNKRNGDSIQVCHISWMNIDYMKNDGKKSFSCKSKDQYHVSQCGEHGYSAQSQKKNGHCYENPSLSHFIDEL